MTLKLIDNPFNPLVKLRASVERELAKTQVQADTEFNIADALDLHATEHREAGAYLQHKVNELAARLKKL